MGNKCVLEEARLYEAHGQYYISAKYIYEDERVKKEIIVPKIKIPFCHDEDVGIKLNRYREPCSLCGAHVFHDFCTINTGIHTLDLELGEVDGYPAKHYYIEKIIKEKKVDLTIEEIEEKLGYKIRVVGEKNG